MKKPWQIWTLYALTLSVVVPAMVWLSWQSLSLEQARETDRIETELARREAELQERVSSALWRMDGLLTNLIAREATRPWYLYQSFYDVAAFEPVANHMVMESENPQAAGTSTLSYRLASPLLFQPSEYVRLHFEIDRNNVVTSPQTPDGVDRVHAYNHGLSDDAFRNNKKLIREVRIICDYHKMIDHCPNDLLPDAPFNQQFTSNQADSWPATNYELQKDRTGKQLAYAPKVLPAAGEPEFSFFKQLQRSLQPEINRFKQKMKSDKEQSTVQTDSQQATKKQLAQQTRNTSRGRTEFSQRQQNADNYAMTEWMGNQMIEPQMAGDASAMRKIREGIMQPLWIDGRLILARRVVKENEHIIQGCWLDWQRIQMALADLTIDLLPEVQFQPYEDQDEIRWGQVLATLPVQLVIDRPAMIQQLELASNLADRKLEENLEQSGFIRRSLWIAWSGLIFAAFASAFLLYGVMRLSERRGAFVSAVSHELRTPLTTFRMYAEMLAEKMVPPERQQQYVETLKVESERLWHLVENVLQFARLERSNQKSRLEEICFADVLNRFVDRLQRRAERAGMELAIELPESVMKQDMKTDPGAIEQILFNLVDNACKYARDADVRRIEIGGQVTPHGQMHLSVRDYGPGVKKQDRQRMFQPFRKSDIEAANTAQGVGLGLALCRRMAKSLGGHLDLAELTDDQAGAKLVLHIPVRS